MKYEEIEKLILEYGKDYLSDGTINKILSLAKGSQSMQKELVDQITEEWITRVKELKEILIYTDSNFISDVPKEIVERKGIQNTFPYVQCSYQDKFDYKSKENKMKIPNLKYVVERVIDKDIRTTQNNQSIGDSYR